MKLITCEKQANEQTKFWGGDDRPQHVLLENGLKSDLLLKKL